MSVKLKIVVYSLVILIIGSVGVVFIKEPSLLFTDTESKSPKTVIIDAGHEAFANTIKTPKNHCQANVEAYCKTRCISGFQHFVKTMI